MRLYGVHGPVVTWALATGWVVLAVFVVHRVIGVRLRTVQRVGELRTAAANRRESTTRAHAGRRSTTIARLVSWPGIRPFVVVMRSLRSRRRHARDALQLQHELPLAVDLLAVAVGAGANPFVAIELAARSAPQTIGHHLDEVVRRVQLGAPLADSLHAALSVQPALRALSETLIPAIRLGSPLQPALQRLAADVRATHARQLAAIARTVPVRLIFPLVLLVLPAFALLTVVPALVAGWHGI